MGGYFTDAGAFLIETLFGLYILAVLLRFMLQLVRADAMRGEQPRGVARAGAVEPQPHWRRRKRRDDSALQVRLQHEHTVKALRAQRLAYCREAAPARASVEGDHLVNRRMSAEQLRERGLLVKAIRPPTVPAGTSRLRVALSARHTAGDVEVLLGALASLEVVPVEAFGSSAEPRVP